MLEGRLYIEYQYQQGRVINRSSPMDFHDEIDSPICVNCGSKNFYRNQENDDLICSDCNTQSQSFSQRETAEDAEGQLTSGRAVKIRRKRTTVIPDESDGKFRVPSLQQYIEAYLDLVESAVRQSVSDELLPNLNDLAGFNGYKNRVMRYSREIFFLFIERWSEAANYFMHKFPELRISLLDQFLPMELRTIMWKQLNQTFSHNADANDEEIADDSSHNDDNADLEQSESDNEAPTQLLSQSQTPSRSRSVQFDDSQETVLFNLQLSTLDTPTSLRFSQIRSSDNDVHAKLWKKLKTSIVQNSVKFKGGINFDNSSYYWMLGILEITPDLDFATAIVYLAHLCVQTGVSSNHFVIWCKSGKYSQLIDGYGCLSPENKHYLEHVKKTWQRSVYQCPNPDTLDRLAIVLLSTLIDPKDTQENFMTEQFRLNVERITKSNVLRRAGKIYEINLSKLIREKIEDMQKKEVERKDNENNQLQESLLEISQDSNENDGNDSDFLPLRIQTLGQLSQNSGESQESQGIQEHDESPDCVSNAPVTFYNVGLMANYFCHLLAVESRVLEFTYALMGLPLDHMRDDGERLPDPLVLARPVMITSPVHLMAVIIAAIKFVPGWDTWVVSLNNCANRSDSGDLSDMESEDELLPPSSQNSKRRKTDSSPSKSDSQKLSDFPVRDSDGKKSFLYTNFMKERKSQHSFAETLSCFPKESNFEKIFGDVKANATLGGIESGLENSQVHQELKQNSYGLSNYFAHKEWKFFYTKTYEPYRYLITFVAEQLAADKKKLHYLVTKLDEEIILTAKIHKRKS